MGRIGRTGAVTLALVTAMAALTALSITWASDGGRAFEKTVQISAVLGIFTLGMFCVRPGGARPWFAGVASGLTFIVILAAIGRFFPGIGDDVELTTNLSGVSGRLSWPLGYWNATGACSAMCGVCLAWFGNNGLSARSRAMAVAGFPVVGLVAYLTSSRGAMVALLIGLLVLVALGPRRRSLLAAIGVGLVGSAAVVVVASTMNELVHAESNSTAESQGLILMGVTFLACAAAGGAWWALNPRMRRLEPRTLKLWQGGLIAIVALAALFALDPVDKVDQFTSPTPLTAEEAEEGENATTSHLLSASGTGRSEYWKSAVHAFQDQPVRGIGAGGFETYYSMDRESGLIGRHTHSLLLQILAELGLIGGLILGGILGVTCYAGIVRWRNGRIFQSRVFGTTKELDPDEAWRVVPLLFGVLAAGAFSMSIDWTGEFPVVFAPVVLAIAMLVGPGTQPDSPARRLDSSSTSTTALAVGTILVGGVAIWISMIGFGLATNLEASREAVADDDLVLALREANDAIEVLPSASEPRIQRALVFELGGRYGDALRSVNEGIERAPDLSSSHLLKARILLRLGRDDAAQMAYERAEELDPSGLIFIEGTRTSDF